MWIEMNSFVKLVKKTPKQNTEAELFLFSAIENNVHCWNGVAMLH